MLDFLADVHIREGGQRHEETILRRANCLRTSPAAGGTPAGEIVRKTGLTDQTSNRWKQRYAGLGVPEIHQFGQLEEENRQLMRLVADLTLDKQMLQDVLSKEL
jgi:putative transposase